MQRGRKLSDTYILYIRRWVLLLLSLYKLCVSRRDTLVILTTLIFVVHCVCFIMYGMHGEFICMV